MLHRRAATAALCAAVLMPWLTASVNADTPPTFAELIAQGRADGTADRPREALIAYRGALSAAHGIPADEQAARFGVARMLLWVGRYEEAGRMYATLLAGDLAADDRQVALAGHVKSLAYRDRPREAYRLLGDAPLTDIDLTVAVAQAASWSGWSDKAQGLLQHGERGIAQLPPSSALARRVRILTDDVHRDRSTTVALTQSYAHDSDGLSSGESVAALRVPVGRTGTVDARLRAFDLHDASWSLHGTESRAGFALRAGDTLTLGASAGRATYDGWTPAVWSADAAYQATDDVRVAAYASGDAIETRTAISNRTTANTVGVRVGLRLADPITLRAGTYAQRFSDGNVRHGYDATLAIAAFPAAGVGLQLRERALTDRVVGSPGYFSPARFEEQDYVVTVRRRIQGWIVDGSAGVGHQAGGGQAGTTFSYALNVRGPLRGCLRVEASLNAQNSALSSASGYRRTAASAGVSCAL